MTYWDQECFLKFRYQALDNVTHYITTCLISLLYFSTIFHHESVWQLYGSDVTYIWGNVHSGCKLLHQKQIRLTFQNFLRGKNPHKPQLSTLSLPLQTIKLASQLFALHALYSYLFPLSFCVSSFFFLWWDFSDSNYLIW